MITLEEERAIVLRYKQGLGTRNIAKEFGISRETARNALRRNNIRPDDRGRDQIVSGPTLKEIEERKLEIDSHLPLKLRRRKKHKLRQSKRRNRVSIPVVSGSVRAGRAGCFIINQGSER